MLRQSRWLIRTCAVALAAMLGAAGCGIKGPLVPAPKPGEAAPATKDSEAPKKP
jgi:predicted small lipoprotein YifL